MHAGDHNEFLIGDAVEKRVRKPVKKGTPGFAMDDWKPIRILRLHEEPRQSLPDILPLSRGAEIRTREKRLRRQLLRLDGRRVTSLRSSADLADHLFPGNAFYIPTIDLIKTVVELRSLGFSKGHGPRLEASHSCSRSVSRSSCERSSMLKAGSAIWILCPVLW